MKNIEEYILATANMENKSNSNNEAYYFSDGTVLIKYTSNDKYPRKNEELVAHIANKKNAKGINTPVHLAIKRVKNGKSNICWVLQEQVKGTCFTNYDAKNNDPKTQLELQKKVLNIPSVHYEKCIMDLCELFNMGLKIESNNIFYDETIGFTFIDLSDFDSTPLNPTSIKDFLKLDKYASFICSIPLINYYDINISITDKKTSEQLYYKMKQKIFIAMEKVVPNFKQHRRWIIRTYSKSELNFFEQNKTLVGDLRLTEKEYNQFNKMINNVINNAIKEIINGQFFQNTLNKMKHDLETTGLLNAWFYQNSNNKIVENFDYNYIYRKALENKVNNMFINLIKVLSEKSTNPYILQAKNEIDNMKAIQNSKTYVKSL